MTPDQIDDMIKELMDMRGFTLLDAVVTIADEAAREERKRCIQELDRVAQWQALEYIRALEDER